MGASLSKAASQLQTTTPPRNPDLPDELLIKIIDAYVKSFTKKKHIAPQSQLDDSKLVSRRRRAANLWDEPDLNNLRLVNKMFHDETRAAITKYVDGRVFLDESNFRMTFTRINDGDLFCLRPYIQVILVDGDYLDDSDFDSLILLLDDGVTPNLKRLVLFFNVLFLGASNRLPQSYLDGCLSGAYDRNIISDADVFLTVQSRLLDVIRYRELPTTLHRVTIRIDETHTLRTAVGFEPKRGGNSPYLAYVKERKIVHVDDIFESDEIASGWRLSIVHRGPKSVKRKRTNVIEVGSDGSDMSLQEFSDLYRWTKKRRQFQPQGSDPFSVQEFSNLYEWRKNGRRIG